jgi:hypothetical protein
MGNIKYILLFLFFGIFWNPLTSYACGENATSKKEYTPKEHHAKQDCCKKKQSSKHDEKEDCKSKCNNTSCNCPNYCLSASMPTFYEIKVERVYFPLQKYYFIFREACLSTGFYSIWLPPKIN